jgi:hypothetical protein
MPAGCETFEEFLDNFEPTNWNWFSKLHPGLRPMNKLNFNSTSIAKIVGYETSHTQRTNSSTSNINYGIVSNWLLTWKPPIWHCVITLTRD